MVRLAIYESEAEQFDNSGPSGGHWGKPMVWEKNFPQITNGTEAGVSGYNDTEYPEQKSHHDDEVLFFYEGEGSVLVGEEEVSVKPGTMVYIEAGTPHCVKRTSKDLLKAAYFHNGQVRE